MNNRICRLCRTMILLFCMAVAMPGFATEPLHDQYDADGLTGRIFPSECCWLQLPASTRLSEMKKAEQGCSAIGGPVGTFKLDGGKLWLTGLYKCGGPVDLHEVYPDRESPVLADWLNGTFKTQLGFVCYDKQMRQVYQLEQVLTVEGGVVRDVVETSNDVSACTRRFQSLN